jgi:hypothetical protein
MRFVTNRLLNPISRPLLPFRFLLVSVHLYFGSDSKEDMERRALETIAVARWAAKRRDSKNAFVSDIIALGDFNLPSSPTTTRSQSGRRSDM